jgi:iron(III) transport system permease protein
MEQTKEANNFKKGCNHFINYFSKPQNFILVVLGVTLTFLTIVPMFNLITDSFTIHTGTREEIISGLAGESFSFSNWVDALTGKLAQKNLWTPFWNTILMSCLSCVFAVLFGGIVAYLVTRTNLKWKKYISSIFIFPYIMPQWTLAVVWKNLFYSNAVMGSADGALAYFTGIHMPEWWCAGIFPCALVLGIHYAPFAYILIGGIFRNMDANLEEAATILNTPKWKTFTRVTLPMVRPAILSTILLVFSSAMGSYPVPHYLGLGPNIEFDALATKYVEVNVSRPGTGSIISIIMMLIGLMILGLNMASTSGRKSYTTVSGKSGQISYVNIGKVGKYLFAIILVMLTFFTSIFPIILFSIETFLANPGDYSSFTTKWWTNNQVGQENGMYGQLGILHNDAIWNAFGGTIFVAVMCALAAGTIGLLVGYCVSKNRKSRFANYVNGIAFLPYLLPSLSVGAAYFVFGNQLGIFNTFFLLILVGTIKYIPFASRSSLSAMMQISGEIEESAIIQNIPWYKRMFKIIIPIQKSSILSGYLLPFITAMRELTLFMMLCGTGKIITTMLDYFDEMGLYAFSSGINLILIVFILLVNFIINKLTGASLDKGIGGK